MDLEENIELFNKFNKKQQFYQEMQKIQANFCRNQQQLLYFPSQNLNSDLILKVPSVSEQRKNYIFTRQMKYIINGQLQPQGERSYQKFLLQFIRTVPRPKSSYGIIYINTHADSNSFSDFKKVLNELPVEYLLNLTKIHVLQPSFFDKTVSWFQFGTIACFINKKIVNVYSLRQLGRSTQLQTDFIYKMVPKNVVSFYIKSQNFLQKDEKIQEITNILPSAKLQKLNKSYSTNQISSFINQKLTKISEQKFKSTKAYQSQEDSFKRQISDYQTGQNGAPLIFQMLIDLCYNNEQFLKQQGIFRKSVSIDDQKQMIYQINKGNYKFLSQNSNHHLIASAIKKFIYNLKYPLIPYQMFQEIMNQDNQAKITRIIVERIRQLPNVSQMTILVLFDFLKNMVAPYAQYNKMSENNLCIVFGPCIMKSPEPGSLKELIYAKKIIVATSIILRQLKNIFGDKTVIHEKHKSIIQRNSIKSQQMLDLPKNRKSKKWQNTGIRQSQFQQFNDKIYQ